MKNNNRNRKLKFIREKNNLRLGKRPFITFAKVTDELMREEFFLTDLVKNASDRLLDRYKLTSKRVIISQMQDSRDFIEDTHTLKIELTNKPL